jgi:ankyrin repeat protein
MDYSYEECEKYIKNNHNKLLNYVNFDLNDNDFLDSLLRYCKDEKILKHIIDNATNLECENKHYKEKPIHFICKYSTPNIIKYIIDKGINLECKTNVGWRPIHFICRFSTPEMIRYIIDKNVDLECETINKWKPIYYICQFSTIEMIIYIIDKGAKININNNNDDLQLEYFIKKNKKLSDKEKEEIIKYINNINID